MLVKVQDGFYLNPQHIIAVHIAKNLIGDFEITLEYTPNSQHTTGVVKKTFSTQQQAEKFLEELHRVIK